MRPTGRYVVSLVVALAVSFALCDCAMSITGAEILKRVSARHDKFMSSVKDWQIEQEMIIVQGGQEVTSAMKSMWKGDKYRVEMTSSGSAGGGQMPKMTTVVVFDGKDTWTVSPFVGKRRLKPSEVKDATPRIQWSDKLKDRVRLVGKEKVDGREAYVIDVNQTGAEASGSLPFSKVWVDTANYQMLKGELKMQDKPAEMRFSDFRKVYGDFTMPFLQQVFVGGVPQTKIVTKSIKTNVGLSDDLFDASKLEGEQGKQEMNMEQMQEMIKRMQGN
ncbi:MAG TPA: outer membrane lipoprotein-sorting protein [bacterium]|nr:outer membrane lipoprotein-sorting protein [bacterium]